MELMDSPVRRRKWVVVKVLYSGSLRNIRVKAKCAQVRGTSFRGEMGQVVLRDQCATAIAGYPRMSDRFTVLCAARLPLPDHCLLSCR